MAKTLISITTYKKCEALDNLLKSLVNTGYSEFPIVVCDDNAGLVDSKVGKNCKEIVEKYSKDIKDLKLCYNEYTHSLGVALNKNRGIREFLKNPEKYDSLLQLDDDILLMQDGLVDHLFKASEKCNISHINGYWTDFDQNRLSSSKLVGLTGNNWYKDFPIKAIGYDEDYNEYISFHQGTQGCCVWAKKDAVLGVGYFNKFPYRYGMEHSAWSARINRLEGLPPELFPVLLRSEKYIMGQNIGNDYPIDHEKLNGIQTLAYRKVLSDTYKGIEILQSESNLPRKGEKVIDFS